MMELDRTGSDDALRIAVRAPRLDAAGALEFRESVLDAAREARGRVLLDLGEVEFLDSSGLGAVIAVMKALAPKATLELAALQPPVARVFRLTRLDEVITIHGAEAGATGQADAG